MANPLPNPEASPEDEQLDERVRKITNMALDKAEDILTRGSAQRQDALIRAVLTNLGHRLKKKSTDDLGALRLALGNLMAQNRQGDGAALPPGLLSAPGLEATPGEPDYSDEGDEL